TMHLFHHEFLDPQGVTYRGRKEEGRRETHFLTGSDYWFRPIHSRVGPDGALYLVDFYNQIAVHNDTRGPAHGARNAAARPDRDHHFTRLWRIQHREATPLPAPRLDPADPSGLVEMLRHPNGWVRGTANRLLTEKPESLAAVRDQVGQLAMDTGASAWSRVHALWLINTLAQSRDTDWVDEAAQTLFADASPVIRKNALRVAAEMVNNPRVRPNQGGTPAQSTQQGVLRGLKDENARVRITALMAAGSLPATRELAEALVAAWPSMKEDRWMQSAAVGAAAAEPVLYLAAALGSADPAAVADLVPHLARLVANRNDPAVAARAVALVAAQPAAVDGLKAAAIESLAAALGAGSKPALDAGVLASLRTLLAADRVAGSTLALVARWGAGAALSSEMKPAIGRALSALKDASLPDATRGQVAANLIGLRDAEAAIIPSLAGLLGGESGQALQKRVIEALGTVPEGGAALVGAFPRLASALLEPAFGQILKRPDSTGVFLDALAARKIDAGALGPARLFRLRTHGNPAIARRADQIIDDLRGPEAKEKDALIARLAPEVEKAGNLENGRKVYTANCAGCHVYKNEGRNLAPNLTGMGAHGPADLLIHIVDPNRVVEANFIAYSLETKSGDQYNGVIERENAAEVVLRDASADHTLRVSDIRSRQSTG
ncbi:MAG: c-type cytochrome, partial [Verrucomicrobiota bacterium]